MQDQDSIQAAEELADELHKKAYPDQYKPEDGKSDDKADDKPSETDEEKAARLKAEEEAEAKRKREEEEKKKAEEKKPEDWEHKYRVLQGKYSAEVPRLHKELRIEKEARVAAEGKLSGLEERVKKLEAAGAGDGSDPAETLKKEFPDIYEGAKKIVNDEIAKAAPEKKAEERKPDPAETPPEVTSFYGILAEIVPTWDKINTDEGFKKWIVERESKYSRRTRLDSLKDAFTDLDAVAVAEFFKDYRDEQDAKGSEARRAEEERLKKEADDKLRKEKDQEDLHPNTGGRGPVEESGDKDKNKITTDDIAQFYKDEASGLYNGRDKERDAMEARIVRASREGRVVRSRR